MNSDALDSLKADGVVWEPQGGKGRFTERALVGKLAGGFSKHKCEFKILLEVCCFFLGRESPISRGITRKMKIRSMN